MSAARRTARRLASIDIGTNSVRLLLAEAGPGRELRTRLRQGAITRLGEGLVAAGKISDGACQRTLEAVRNFVEEAEYGGAENVIITATSAMRVATNGPEVASTIGREVGYPVTILSGEEEARLVYRAVGADEPGPRGVVDIGGGSTEVICGRDGGELTVRSLTLGAVSLTERFVSEDPPHPGVRERLVEFIREALRSKLGGVALEAGSRLFGVGGTVTAIAATDKNLPRYDPSLIEGHTVTRTRAGELADMLWRTPLGERRMIPGVSVGRADIILAGACILLEIMDHLRAPAFVASTRGLRYGILLQQIDGDPSSS